MTSTAKNFAGQNLRGMSFKGQDLSGSDFSGADLRGSNFTDAILRGANFSKVNAGVQKQSLVYQLIIVAGMFTLFGFLVQFAYSWAIAFITPSPKRQLIVSAGISIIILWATAFFAIFWQGFTTLSFWITGSALALAVAINATFSGNAGGALVAGGVFIAGAVAGAITIAVANAINEFWGSVFVVAIGVFLAINNARYLGDIEYFVYFLGLVASTMVLSIYIAFSALKGDPKFDTLLKFSVAFASVGGTSFRGTDLKNADFTEANLKSSDFRNSRQQSTNFNRSIWKQAKKLDRARLGTSILSTPEVRELLVTGKPNPSKSYEGLNLRGANLDGVYLENVNFKCAILSEASFRNANLEWVNLTETQAIGTDFTGAQITGVCLEGWSYDHTTKLDDVDCRFVFELEHPNTKGSRERRPHDPDKEFAKGDFTKRYSGTLNVVQLLIRNGINREAFIEAWSKLTADYPDLSPDDIQEIKKKGQDVELTVAVPEDTDKGKFEHNFDLGYETKLKEIEARYQAQLEAKEALILLQKQNITDIKEILQIAKSSNINFSPTFQTEAKAVAEQNPVTIKAGRDISGNVINLGEIKGDVTNAINQIPNKEDSGDIKTLLTQLQEAISSDKELADEDKADALEQVENLAKIALHDKPEEKSTLASKAIRALKRIIDNIPTITKIVETVSKVFGA